MPKVTLITTGGTIASRKDPVTGDVVAAMDADSLRATLHDPLDGIDLEVVEFSRIGSNFMTLQKSYDLAQRINAALEDPDCSGVAVTHGTDTMEEAVFMADLLIRGDKPVVFTGAQRHADEPDTDGPHNIADAVRVAASPRTRGLGAMICFEQEFHAARDVTKTHSLRVDTFHSNDMGKLGEIVGTDVRVYRRPVLRRTYAAPGVEEDVELLTSVIGGSARQLVHAREDGAKGFVIQGFGSGNTTTPVSEEAIRLVAAGYPVVMTSRCPRGSVRPVYGAGGGKTLSEAGVIFAGDLAGVKARVLLSVLLGMGLSSDQIRREMGFMGGAEGAAD